MFRKGSREGGASQGGGSQGYQDLEDVQQSVCDASCRAVGQPNALKDTDDVLLSPCFVFQHLEFQSELVCVFCVEPHHRSVRVIVKGLNLLAEAACDSQVLQDIAHGVVNVLHSRQWDPKSPRGKIRFPIQMNVFVEALLVGLFLIPMGWIVEKLFPTQGKWVKLFAAGALFHLTAEFTGINKSYVLSKLD